LVDVFRVVRVPRERQPVEAVLLLPLESRLVVRHGPVAVVHEAQGCRRGATRGRAGGATPRAEKAAIRVAATVRVSAGRHARAPGPTGSGKAVKARAGPPGRAAGRPRIAAAPAGGEVDPAGARHAAGHALAFRGLGA